MICLLGSCATPQAEERVIDAAAVANDTNYVSVDLRKLPGGVLPPPEVVEVRQDHSLRTAKRYEAYPLRPLLDRLVAKHDLNITATQVMLECKDGYTASNTLQELYATPGGYLAFRDLDAPTSEDWPDSLRARYAPFYLVWKDIPYDEHRLTWPYGLIKLHFSTNDPYVSLYPHERPELAEAFTHYRANCLKCHALNRIGGTMGPEFNVPKNITEYWTRNNIVAFAKNPRSFRYNSKMYAITHLSDDELHDVVSYLEYMADHKIVNNE